MKILITHVYSKHNKGDHAILSAMVYQVRKVFPSSRIIIHSAEKGSFSHEASDISTVKSFFFFCLYERKNTFLRIFNTTYILSTTLLWAYFHKLFNVTCYSFIPSRVRATCESYLEADLVLPVGGQYISGKNSIQSYVTLFIQLHAIILAELLNKKIILYSQSIGPFSNKFQEVLVRIVLNKTSGIFAREDKTIQILKKIGVYEHLIYRTVDAAFSFKSNKKKSMRTVLKSLGINSKIVGITVRQWLSERKQNNFEEQISEFVKYLVNKKKYSVVFIPQVTSTLHNDDDRVVNKRIREKLKGIKNVYYIDQKYSPYEIKGLYENLDYLVGTRMHSIIFSLTGKIPCIAIEYEHKTSGIMSDLGLAEHVIKIEHVTGGKLTRMFEHLEINKNRYLRQLETSLKAYTKFAKRAPKIVRKIYLKNSPSTHYAI